MPQDKEIVKSVIKAKDIHTTHHTQLKKNSWEEVDSWYKKIVPHDDFFAIEKLPVKPLTIENIYDNEDDFRTPSTESREAQFLKMGKLLIFCQNLGKGGFLLGIKLKDEANRNLTETPLFFKYNGSRYPLFHFDDLMPFSIAQLDVTATFISHPEIDKELKKVLDTLRSFFTKFALEVELSPEEMQQFYLAVAQFNIHTNPASEPEKTTLKLFDKTSAAESCGKPRTDTVAEFARKFELELIIHVDPQSSVKLG